jgi:RES domain
LNPSVLMTSLADKAHCEPTFHRPLRLAKLLGTGLKKLKAERVDLIESMPPCYANTASRAQAIYDQDQDIDGLIWRSRRLDDQDSYALFGDRVKPVDYTGRAATGPISTDAASRARVYQEALAVGVLLLP